jgi:hypothetical protein
MAKRCPECREEFSSTGRRVRKRDVWCIAVGPKDCGKTHVGYHEKTWGQVFQNARFHTLGVRLVLGN